MDHSEDLLEKVGALPEEYQNITIKLIEEKIMMHTWFECKIRYEKVDRGLRMIGATVNN